MKSLIFALALSVAAPAAAQSADPHAGHDSHEQHKDCCDHKSPDGTPMKCCEKAGEDGKKMACCEKHEGKDDAHAGHGQH